MRRMMGVGLCEPSSASGSDPASSSSNISGTRGGRARRLTWGEASGFSAGRRALGRVSFLGDDDFGEGMLKFLRIEPKLLIKLWTWDSGFSTNAWNKQRDRDLRRDRITNRPGVLNQSSYEPRTLDSLHTSHHDASQEDYEWPLLGTDLLTLV